MSHPHFCHMSDIEFKKSLSFPPILPHVTHTRCLLCIYTSISPRPFYIHISHRSALVFFSCGSLARLGCKRCEVFFFTFEHSHNPILFPYVTHTHPKPAYISHLFSPRTFFSLFFHPPPPKPAYISHLFSPRTFSFFLSLSFFSPEDLAADWFGSRRCALAETSDGDSPQVCFL